MGLVTGQGDAGESFTLGGTRRPKCHGVFHVVGEFDALVVALGEVKVLGRGMGNRALVQQMEDIQKDLMKLAGGVSREDQSSQESLRWTASQMEEAIQALLPRPLTGFVLPGSNPLETALHRARVVCRSLERELVALQPTVSTPQALQTINRLSDLLFALAVTHSREEPNNNTGTTRHT